MVPVLLDLHFATGSQEFELVCPFFCLSLVYFYKNPIPSNYGYCAVGYRTTGAQE